MKSQNGHLVLDPEFSPSENNSLLWAGEEKLRRLAKQVQSERRKNGYPSASTIMSYSTLDTALGKLREQNEMFTKRMERSIP